MSCYILYLFILKYVYKVFLLTVHVEGKHTQSGNAELLFRNI